jgi:hypothetical protein
MAVKDWPRPLRLAIGWLFVLLAGVIVALPTWLLVIPFAGGRFLDLGDTPWSIILAHYSTLITAPVAVVCSLAAFRHFVGKGDRQFAFYLLMGAAIGVAIGLLLTPVTGGFSLVSAPPFAGWTMIIAWLIRRPDRDPPIPGRAEGEVRGP